MEAAAALKHIAVARKQFEKVDKLLLAMGQKDSSLALTQRFAAAMSAPMDLADETRAERYGDLMMEMDRLMQRLQQDFLG